jgi:hypothetical protein
MVICRSAGDTATALRRPAYLLGFQSYFWLKFN